jgi:hypothetical protein
MTRGAFLRRELAACVAMVRLAYQVRANQGRNWLSWCIVAVILLCPVLMLFFSVELSTAIGAGAGIPLLLLWLCWWPMLVSSLAQQRTHTARLVPGTARRAVIVMLAGAAGGTLVLTPPFVLAGGAPPTVIALVMLVLTGLAASVLIAFVRNLFNVLILVQVFAGSRLAALLPFSPQDLLVAASPVLIAGLGYAALRTMHRGLPQQGSLSDILRARTELASAGMSAGPARKFRRDCDAGRIDALLMCVLGLPGRVPSLRFFALATGITPLIAHAWQPWVASHRPLLGMLIPAMMAALQVFVVTSIAEAVSKTGREQALVRMSPRAPGASALNAVLARTLMLQYGRYWLGSTALALLSLFFLGVADVALLRILAVFLVTLTCGNLLLRDYASERAASRPTAAWILLVVVICLVGLAASATSSHPGPWLATACGALAIGIALAGLRWKRMLSAPAAFPAARAR